MFRYDTHTEQEPGLIFCCHVVTNLQFTLVLSSLFPAEAGCETCERMFYRWSLLRNNYKVFTLFVGTTL